MKEYAVQAVNVTKKFNNIPILQDLSFEIHKNTKLAILGHNGSGKSSLLKLIAGIYVPTSGKLNKHGKKIGYVPEHFPDNIRFRLREYLMLMGTIGGQDRQEIRKKIDYYIDLFQLQPHAGTMLKDCSKGTKQKAGIIQAMLDDCDILLLDEPLTGLDDESKKAFLDMIRQIERDFALIFTAHEQETVELLAEEVMVLENGTIIKHEAITEKIKMKCIVARLSKRLNREELKMYGSITGETGNKVELIVTARNSDDCLLYLLENGCSIIEVKEKI